MLPIDDVSKEARDLHREAVVVDLHADTPDLMRLGFDFHARHLPLLPAGLCFGHLDGPRMKQGGLTAQVFGLFVMAWFFRRRFWERILEQVDATHATVSRRPDGLRLVRTAEEIRQAKRDGVPAGMFCLEGAHPLAGRLDRLEELIPRGLRAVGFLHFVDNEAGAPAMGRGRNTHEALRPFGRALVEFCNERGLLIDLAHINRPGFLEAARLSRAPVMVSHTGVTGVKPHRRNIDDDQIRAVADTGGCIGIIYARNFLGGAGLDRLMLHLEHVLRVGGEDCPALGSDFDGYVLPPRGLADVTTLPRITDRLLHRGHAPRVVRKILGGNALRVIEAVPPRTP